MTTLRDWGSTHDRAELDRHITRDDDVDDTAPLQYLAWGGESEASFSIVTAEQIRKDIEQSTYSGYRTWTKFALLATVGADDDGAILIDVVVVSVDDREVDDSDYVHQTYQILRSGDGPDADPKLVDTFVCTTDGRA